MNDRMMDVIISGRDVGRLLGDDAVAVAAAAGTFSIDWDRSVLCDLGG